MEAALLLQQEMGLQLGLSCQCQMLGLQDRALRCFVFDGPSLQKLHNNAFCT